MMGETPEEFDHRQYDEREAYEKHEREAYDQQVQDAYEALVEELSGHAMLVTQDGVPIGHARYDITRKGRRVFDELFFTDGPNLWDTADDE